MHEHGDYDAEQRERVCAENNRGIGRQAGSTPEAPNASRGPSIEPSWCAIWNEEANATVRPRRDEVRADVTQLARHAISLAGKPRRRPAQALSR